jgi:hypothetical protein
MPGIQKPCEDWATHLMISFLLAKKKFYILPDTLIPNPYPDLPHLTITDRLPKLIPHRTQPK